MDEEQVFKVIVKEGGVEKVVLVNSVNPETGEKIRYEILQESEAQLIVDELSKKGEEAHIKHYESPFKNYFLGSK